MSSKISKRANSKEKMLNAANKRRKKNKKTKKRVYSMLKYLLNYEAKYLLATDFLLLNLISKNCMKYPSKTEHLREKKTKKTLLLHFAIFFPITFLFLLFWPFPFFSHLQFFSPYTIFNFTLLYC